jgi:hypothetical protein
MTAQLPQLMPPPVDPGDRRGGPIDAAPCPGQEAHPAPRLTARSLARLHDRYLSAVWRGEDVGDVADWLAAHWQESAPPMPRGLPDAVSFGGTASIRWYCQGTMVAGYPQRSETGCYRVPIWAVPPAVAAPVP